jgi:hypothetical protein
MNILKLAFKEASHRKVNFLMGICSVIIAVATLTGSITLLKLHDLSTQKVLTAKEEETEKMMAELKNEMRVAMLKLGLNLVVLPKDQDVGNWYMEGGKEAYMPENYVDILADSGVITVRHFLPTLREKIKWPEMNRRIVLVGTRGEVPNLHKSKKEPIVQPVPDGTVVLGSELSKSLDLKVKDKVRLLGREFTVHRCHKERGNEDDITAWIPLKAAQKLLDKEGKINSIVALQCICKGPDFSQVRKDITSVLPDTRVIELGTERRLARAEARMSVGRKARQALEEERLHRARIRADKELFASVLIGVVLVACCVWLGFLFVANVRQRSHEIGILQALGFSSSSVLKLFLIKSFCIAVTGIVSGLVLGLVTGVVFSLRMEKNLGLGNIEMPSLFNKDIVLAVFFVAPLLIFFSSFLPAVMASRQDPAAIIRKESA